ncbi:hypothetical protein FDG95_gp062 [Pectobacterium phage vB_PcaM_CBB]|uniref:Uncharacterized protein n=1 Tax=Pectobacterium phage vB_PcaM_CBB TaxID=2772511 RepID=A0A1L2CUF2_9CAUD|nr:hypothetical protein FDG95_gp062 [Pectobacterium phage vB_PcaM_CBB]AMM43627.1 hypothetical protein CBB_62 [Pectobacterium phage vB_PcaM_CBB]
MAKSKKTEKVVVNNPVAKHMETFNKPKTFTDRKKDNKNGKIKHKGRYDASFDVSKE